MYKYLITQHSYHTFIHDVFFHNRDMHTRGQNAIEYHNNTNLPRHDMNKDD